MEHFINNILGKMTGVAKPQKKFLVILFLTILLMRGKVNFRNMSRYSDLNEKTYSRQFRKPFDFADFNKQLIEETVPSHHEKIAVMDCSFITKSGKETYGLGFFYDSSHDQAAKGLEVSNLAVIDVTDNTTPYRHHMTGRAGRNTIEVNITSASRNPAVMQLDFSGSEHFVPGSLRVESGSGAEAAHEAVERQYRRDAVVRLGGEVAEGDGLREVGR